MHHKRYHLDSRFLTLSFFVSMPLVTFGAFLVVSIAKDKLQSSVGQNLEQHAFATKTILERYIGDRIVHFRLLSQDPLVMNALLERRDLSGADRARRLEHAWLTGQPKDLTASLLSSPLALRLRETTRLLPTVKLLQVVHRDGHLIASSARGGRFYLNERPWFAGMAMEELVSVHVGEIQFASRSPGYLEIAYPIYHPKSGDWIGALYAVVSANDLYAVLAPVRIGQTGRALLLRASDGRILVSDESDRAMIDTFSGFSSIQTGIQARQGYWIIPRVTEWSSSEQTSVTEPARLVGFSAVDQVPGVHWIVAVEQSLAEATAPIRDVTRYLWIHFLGALTAVMLLSIYLGLRQEQPIIEEALRLHEEHIPPSMQRRAADTQENQESRD
jgi:hypothetical protein